MGKWFIRHGEGEPNENVEGNKSNNKLKRNTKGQGWNERAFVIIYDHSEINRN
jgi:hypothetical protein